MTLAHLSDGELVMQVETLCAEGHRLTARLLVHLIEVEDRRLELKSAYASMTDFCRRHLRMSEGAAFRRTTGARLVRAFPQLLERIERGELSLSVLVLLRHHLTADTVDALVAEVAGKSERQVELLLARRAPRPDVPDLIELLGVQGSQAELPNAPAAAATATEGAAVAAGAGGGSGDGAGATAADPSDADDASSVRPRMRGVEPLSVGRYRVQLTASASLCEKLERACDLMRHRNPTGALAPVLERALDVLLEKLEKECFGTLSPSRKVATREAVETTARGAAACKREEEEENAEKAEEQAEKERKEEQADAPNRAPSGRVSRSTRREVFARDGRRCTFVSADGRRCEARGLLQLDHADSVALDGDDEPENLRVRCWAHNQLHAEEIFGKEHVASCIDLRRRKLRRVIGAPPASSPIDDVAAQATQGLIRLGFGKSESEKAIAVVTTRSPGLPIESLLREAIAILT